MAIATDAEKLRQITKALMEEFNPSRLFLFGSRAIGTANKNSDYDFLVVVKKTNKSRAEDMLRASTALDHLDVNADVFVYSEKEFEEWKSELGSIPEIALNTGQEIPLK